MPNDDVTQTPDTRAATKRPVTPIVEVRGLPKSHGDKIAVDNLPFSLWPGTITGFLGPNGAGKTTTIRLLLGLARPTAGVALIFGSTYREIDRPAIRIGAVLESGNFDFGRTGRNHLRCFARAMDINDERVDELLEFVQIRDVANSPIRSYSLGMRQRLSLAIAVLGDPEVLVLDEPTNGLDAAGVHWLRSTLQNFASSGKTVLVSSHLLAEIGQTAANVLIMARGRLLAQLRLDQLDGGADALERFYLHLTSEKLA